MWMDWDVKDVNYKLIDTQRIIDYITSFPKGISVESIIQNSGADKLRVYPALFELEQSGWLEVAGKGRTWCTVGRSQEDLKIGEL